MAISNRITNSLFQSQVLPIIERASLELKKLVSFYALTLKPKWELEAKIKGVIKAVDEKLPKQLIDRQKYIDSLNNQADKLIREFYDTTIRRFYLAVGILVILGIKKEPKTPIELYQYIEKNKVELDKKIDLKYEAKGYPQVENYQNELRKRIDELAKEPIDADSGISLWQKAELDLRHEKQENRLQELQEQGVRYAWTSTHPDCSKRCQPWQGKLYDLVAPSSELSNHRMRKKLDGNTVYCFEEVSRLHQYGKNGKDYGENSIIRGYNCRHKLIPYTKGSVAPTEYTREDIKLEREVNARLRELERAIRKYKELAILHRPTNVKLSKQYEAKANALFNEYKRLCERYGFAIQMYRVKV